MRGIGGLRKVKFVMNNGVVEGWLPHWLGARIDVGLGFWEWGGLGGDGRGFGRAVFRNRAKFGVIVFF